MRAGFGSDQLKFRMMSKVDVNGENISPVFRFLKTSFPGTIRWNFGAKFLVSRAGHVVKRTRLLPLQLEDDIAALLQESS